jgi:hypothetical protein
MPLTTPSKPSQSFSYTNKVLETDVPVPPWTAVLFWLLASLTKKSEFQHCLTHSLVSLGKLAKAVVYMPEVPEVTTVVMLHSLKSLSRRYFSNTHVCKHQTKNCNHITVSSNIF